jgi:hypothetical protein
MPDEYRNIKNKKLMCQSCNQPMRALIPELEDLIRETPKVKRMVNPKKVFCDGFPRRLMPPGGVTPADYLEKVVQRAVELINHTVDELKRVRVRILAGDPIKPPLLRTVVSDSLARRMNIRAEDRAAWKGAGPGSVGLVIRWLGRMGELLASGDLRYTCLSKDPTGCTPTARAWTFAPLHEDFHKDPPLDFFHIRLCEHFWTLPKDKDGNTVSPKVKFEFQAQTLMHEVSHIFYSTLDDIKVGPWIAECLLHFVAETNGIDTDFELGDQCVR